MNEGETKRCPVCGASKPILDFPPNRASPDGRQHYCRPCYKTYLQQYYQAHREELADKGRAYREASWPTILATHRERTRVYRAADPERTRLLDHVSNVVRWAKHTGRLVPATTCEDCGTTARRITAAHEDYSQPLVVRWLCYSCHARWDAAEPKLGNWRTS